jgi:hypothetical protein
MTVSSPEKTSMVEQTDQTERGEHGPAVPVGGTGGLYRVPVPPPTPAPPRPTRQDLERAAVAAHHRSMTWAQFWPDVAQAVTELEPWDNQAYRRIVARLSHLLTCGDVDGMQPAGDGSPPQAADEPVYPARDDRTQARINWQAAGIVPRSVGTRGLFLFRRFRQNNRSQERRDQSMTTRPRPERFTIILQALPGDPAGPPPALRLRRLLKYAGRVCRLRCVTCKQTTPPCPQPPGGSGQTTAAAKEP